MAFRSIKKFVVNLYLHIVEEISDHDNLPQKTEPVFDGSKTDSKEQTSIDFD